MEITFLSVFFQVHCTELCNYYRIYIYEYIAITTLITSLGWLWSIESPRGFHVWPIANCLLSGPPASAIRSKLGSRFIRLAKGFETAGHFGYLGSIVWAQILWATPVDVQSNLKIDVIKVAWIWPPPKYQQLPNVSVTNSGPIKFHAPPACCRA